MGRKRAGDRVIGVRERGGSFQVRYVENAEGRSRTFPTEGAAEKYAAFLRETLSGGFVERTVDEAVDDYEAHLKEKGNKKTSWHETPRRLRRFFPDWDLPLLHLNHTLCQGYYTRLSTWKCAEGAPCHSCAARNKRLAEGAAPTFCAKKLAADTHRNYLLEARSFLRWCEEEKKWIDRNPLEKVKGSGRRRHGKLKSSVDEARKWRDKAVDMAVAGEEGAVAALMTQLLGVRASEVTNAVCRDLDDDGHVFSVEDTKTEAGRRRIDVPDDLRILLMKLTKDRPPFEPIFLPEKETQSGRRDRGWPTDWVHVICEAAGVPQVTSQGMRGFHATHGRDREAEARKAAELGHRDYDTTTKVSYEDQRVADRVRQKRVMKVLDGGRKSRPVIPE